MNWGPRKQQIRSEAMPPMRTSPSTALVGRHVWFEHAFQAHRPRALHEHAVAGARDLLEQRAGLLGRRHRVALALERLAVRERIGADGDEHVYPPLRRVRADLAVVTVRL